MNGDRKAAAEALSFFVLKMEALMDRLEEIQAQERAIFAEARSCGATREQVAALKAVATGRPPALGSLPMGSANPPARLDGEFVYFIEAPSIQAIKIGFSINVAQRFAALAGGSPFPMRLIGHVRGSFNFERYLHAKFKAIRMNGEWFRDTTEIRAEIDRLLSDEDYAAAQLEASQPQLSLALVKVED